MCVKVEREIFLMFMQDEIAVYDMGIKPMPRIKPGLSQNYVFDATMYYVNHRAQKLERNSLSKI